MADHHANSPCLTVHFALLLHLFKCSASHKCNNGYKKWILDKFEEHIHYFKKRHWWSDGGLPLAVRWHYVCWFSGSLPLFHHMWYFCHLGNNSSGEPTSKNASGQLTCKVSVDCDHNSCNLQYKVPKDHWMLNKIEQHPIAMGANVTSSSLHK